MQPITIILHDDQPGIITWLQILGFLVALASLVFLAIYVKKTADIAKSNQEAAQAAKRAAEGTAESVALARGTLAEMQETRDAESAPYVVVWLEVRNHAAFLSIENTGRMVARDVTLTFNPSLKPDLFAGGISPGFTLPAFVLGKTPILAPGQKMTRILNSFPGLVQAGNSGVPLQYEVTVHYRGGALDKERDDQFVLDVNSFLGASLTEDKLAKAVTEGMASIANAVEKLKEGIGNIDERLGSGIALTPGSFAQMDSKTTEECIRRFRALVADLASTWRVWTQNDQQVRQFSMRLAYERLRQITSELAALISYLDIADTSADHIRTLIIDLEAQSKWLEFDVDATDSINEIIAKLLEVAQSLVVDGLSGSDLPVAERGAGEVSLRNAAFENPTSDARSSRTPEGRSLPSS